MSDLNLTDYRPDNYDPDANLAFDSQSLIQPEESPALTPTITNMPEFKQEAIKSRGIYVDPNTQEGMDYHKNPQGETFYPEIGQEQPGQAGQTGQPSPQDRRSAIMADNDAKIAQISNLLKVSPEDQINAIAKHAGVDMKTAPDILALARANSETRSEFAKLGYPDPTLAPEPVRHQVREQRDKMISRYTKDYKFQQDNVLNEAKKNSPAVLNETLKGLLEIQKYLKQQPQLRSPGQMKVELETAEAQGNITPAQQRQLKTMRDEEKQKQINAEALITKRAEVKPPGMIDLMSPNGKQQLRIEKNSDQHVQLIEKGWKPLKAPSGTTEKINAMSEKLGISPPSGEQTGKIPKGAEPGTYKGIKAYKLNNKFYDRNTGEEIE